MNNEIFELDILDTITNLKIFEAGIKIELKSGNNINISDYHMSDCCEKVYADWSILEYHIKDIINKKYDKLIIKQVEEIGFILYFKLPPDKGDYDYNYGVKVLIPCYNIQNGYYSTELSLIINNETTIDITSCTPSIEI